jgi:two-component system nitrate/nitrite response regulator NarP
MRRLRLLIAEDHPLMVEAIRVVLSISGEFEIVGVAESGSEVLPLAQRLDPDVVLVDLRLPGLDGLEVLHALRKAGVGAKLVGLSARDESDVVELALRAGACAFITKRIDPHDFPAALRQALDQTLFQPFKENPLLMDGGPPEPSLTKRELAVLNAVAEGLSNKEIAQRLSYAEQTVKLDLTHVYRKLGVSSRTEAMAVGYRRGLIDTHLVELAPSS